MIKSDNIEFYCRGLIFAIKLKKIGGHYYACPQNRFSPAVRFRCSLRQIDRSKLYDSGQISHSIVKGLHTPFRRHPTLIRNCRMSTDLKFTELFDAVNSVYLT